MNIMSMTAVEIGKKDQIERNIGSRGRKSIFEPDRKGRGKDSQFCDG